MATPAFEIKTVFDDDGKPKGLPADYIPEIDEIGKMDQLQLEVEIERLKIILAQMRRCAENTDTASGLPNRERFMELATVEFNRSRRYNRELSLIVANIVGYGKMLDKNGEDAANQILLRVAEICSGSTRIGLDVVGRLGPNKLAILLPEAGTKNCHSCLERMHGLLEAAPLTIDGEPIKIGLNFSSRTLKDTHNSFVELLVSA